jgi:predicted MPP superfamily phosphohydrolase
MGHLWLGILLLLLMSIIGVHLFNGVLKLAGWGAMTPQAIYSSILVMTTGMTLYGLYAAYRSPGVVEYTVDRRQRYGQNKSLSIVHLSDLHLGYDLGHRFLNNVIRTTNALNPDIIVITGDIMESSPDYFRRFRQDFRKFQAPYGTYAVTGNHDFYNGVVPFIKIMGESGIPVLQNELIRLYL